MGWIGKTLFLWVFLVFVIPAKGLAQENILPLTLDDCIYLAFKNNKQLHVERLGPLKAEANVELNKGEFDTELALDINRGGSRLQTTARQFAVEREEATLFPIREYDQRNWEASLSKRLLTGTNVDLTWVTNRSDSNFTLKDYLDSIELDITQNLLRGWGYDVNRTRITIAENQYQISRHQLREAIMEVLALVENTYWDLCSALEALRVKKVSLKRAEEFLELNKALVEVGRLPYIDLIQAEAEVAKRKEDVILAQRDVRLNQLKLIQIVNPSNSPDMWKSVPQPLTKPEFTPYEPNIEESLRLAFENRPDIIMAKLGIQNDQLSVREAKNQLFPQLDLVSRISLRGRDDDHSDAFGYTFGGGYYDWYVGLTFSFPLKNRKARAAFRKAKLTKKGSEISFEDIEQLTQVEVRSAIIQLEANRERIQATKLARRLAEEKLKREEEKFKVGKSTIHEVLEYQEDLANTELNQNKALIDYLKSLVELRRVEATLLERWNIEV
ncbi:MAG TPA: TolC family protein [Syntrophaceae bacterium]|nr:TolC family protein [Syntrophaceae bacterium]